VDLEVFYLATLKISIQYNTMQYNTIYTSYCKAIG